jgi:hypothetical protein
MYEIITESCGSKLSRVSEAHRNGLKDSYNKFLIKSNPSVYNRIYPKSYCK